LASRFTKIGNLQYVFKYVIVNLRGTNPLVLPHLKYFNMKEVVTMAKKDFLILALIVIIILEIIFD